MISKSDGTVMAGSPVATSITALAGDGKQPNSIPKAAYVLRKHIDDMRAEIKADREFAESLEAKASGIRDKIKAKQDEVDEVSMHLSLMMASQ